MILNNPFYIDREFLNIKISIYQMAYIINNNETILNLKGNVFD